MEAIERDGKKFITASVLAEEFGYDRNHIGLLARQGKVDGVLIDKKWFVTRKSLEEYRFRAVKNRSETARRGIQLTRRPLAPSLSSSHIADGNRAIRSYLRAVIESAAIKTTLRYALVALFVLAALDPGFGSAQRLLKTSQANIFSFVTPIVTPIQTPLQNAWRKITFFDLRQKNTDFVEQLNQQQQQQIEELKEQLKNSGVVVQTNNRILERTVERIVSQPGVPVSGTLESRFQKIETVLLDYEERFRRTPTILVPVSGGGGGGGSSGTTVLNPATLESQTVKVSNLLDVDGSGDISGALVVGGNLTIDTNTFFVDSTNNRVGVLTTSPETAFEVVGTASVSALVGSAFTGISNCNTESDTLLWNSSTGIFSCGVDSGAGSATFKTEEGGATVLDSTSILNFSGSQFTLTASGTTETVFKLDWGADAPASKAANETITGLWKFTGASTQFTGLELGGFASISATGANNFNINLTSTGDFIIQDAGSNAFTVSDTGVVTFGISASHSAAGDFRITDDLVVVGSVSGGTISGFGLSNCTGSNKLLWTSSSGLFSCAVDETGGGGGGSGTIEVEENLVFQDVSVASLSFDAGAFNITASGSNDVTIKLDYDNGPASRAKNETITGFWKFSAASTQLTGLELVNNASIGGNIALKGNITGATGYNGLVITPNTGVITTGTWEGTVITSTFGGTGVNNAGRTITLNAGNITFAPPAGGATLTLANNFTTSGNNALTLTTTGATDVTLPTTGILAVLGANTFTGLQTFSGGASSSTGFEITTGNLGINAGGATDTRLEVGGTASIGGNFAFFGEIQPEGLTCANNEILKKVGAGQWGCAADATGGGGGTQIELSESLTQDSGTLVSSVSFDPNGFNVSFPGGGLVKLDWTNGPASRAADQTITGFWKFNAASTQLTGLELGGFASISITGTSNSTINLTNTGDLLIQDAGTTFVTFRDDGVVLIDNIQLDTNTITTSTGDLTLGATSNVVITPTGNIITLNNAATDLVDITGRASVSANFEVGTNVFYVDQANSRVGIGTQNLTQALEIVGGASLSGTASISGDLTFFGEIRPDGVVCSNGQILKKTGANDWDCAADATGGGGGGITGIEVKEFNVFQDTNVASLSFDGAHFAITASGTEDVSIKLDWGAGGPASLSQSETVTGLWNFTGASTQFTGLELAGFASVSATGASNLNFNLTNSGDFIVQDAGATFFTLSDTGVLTLDSIRLDGTTIDTTAGNLTIGSNGNTVTINDAVTDLLAITGNASVSGNFELTGASALLGINAGNVINTALEVGGAASISGQFTFGNNSATGAIDTSDWDISTTGALTGISGITNDGVYTQSGTGANTFSGATTFSAAGTGLTVNNNATVSGLLSLVNASVSDRFELTSSTGRFGINAGGFTDVAFEVGGNASISGTASISGDLSFSGEIRPDGLLCSNGQILKKTGANDWDCAADDTGAGGGGGIAGIELRELGLFNDKQVASISFEPGHFSLTASDSQDVIVKLDWGAGGPASLSQNETVTGFWNFTAASTQLTGLEIGGFASISITGTSNSTINLTNTGDLLIQDAGTTFVTFRDDGVVIIDSLQLDGSTFDTSGASTLTIGGTNQTGLTLGRSGQSTTLAGNVQGFTLAGTITGSGSPTITSIGQVDFTNASGSGRLELTGASSRLGINAGAATETSLEVGGTASISGIVIDSTGINLGTGDAYSIGGTSILNATTLGSGVTVSSLQQVGTITTGVWQGTVIDSTYGGTGVNNAGRTITLNTGNITFAPPVAGATLTLAANFTTSGANALTLTTTGVTDVTLPTTGILAILGANTFTGLQTFSGGASSSTGFEITTGNLGINAGGETTTRLEVGGSASISGQFTFGNNSATGAIDTSDWDISTTGAITGIAFDANATGNTLSNVDNADITADTLDFTAILDNPTLDASLNISRAGFFIGLGAAPSTVFEVQGTSSASYFLTGNTIQVGGYASVAYSRFGIAATDHAGSITTTNDVLISGDLEINGSAAFDGILSFFGEIAPDGVVCSNGEILKKTGANDWDCAADAGGGVSSNSLDFDELVNSMRLDAFGETGTSIGFGANNLTLNLDGTGDFIVQDNGSTFLTFLDTGGASVSKPFTFDVASTRAFVVGDGTGGYSDDIFTVDTTASATNPGIDIVATNLTTAGTSALTISVPASTSAAGRIPHGVLWVTDSNSLTLASMSNAGTLGIRGIYTSHGGSITNCTGVSTPSSGCIDLAENFPTEDETLVAGEVVSITAGGSDTVVRAAPGSIAIGVVSTNPAALITGTSFMTGAVASNRTPGYAPIALAGRVPVKVSTENGAIKAGDYLTNSATQPGVAMKATQAGQTIGQALTPYSGDGIGQVTIFIQTGFFGGQGLELTAGVSQDDPSFASALLSRLAGQGKTKKSDETPKSGQGFYIDTLAAGTEVISPLIYTQDLFVSGNASISGELFANKISAKEISGLEFITDSISSLSEKVASISIPKESMSVSNLSANNIDVLSGFSSKNLIVLGLAEFRGSASFGVINADKINAIDIESGEITEIADKIALLASKSDQFAIQLDALVSKSADFESRITILEEQVALNTNEVLQIKNALSVDGLTALNGGLQVDSVSSLGDAISFLNDVIFFGRPYFNNDTGGFAVIKQGQRFVDITFNREYLEQPVVNATITLDEASSSLDLKAIFNGNISFLVINKSGRGFTITLSKAAPFDIQFSWIALAVKNAKTFALIESTPPLSGANETLSVSPEPTPEPTPEPIPEPTPSEEPTPTPEASPSSTPSPSESPTPEPSPEPSPTPESTPEPTPKSIPEPTPEPTPTPSPTPELTPIPEPTPEPTE